MRTDWVVDAGACVDRGLVRIDAPNEDGFAILQTAYGDRSVVVAAVADGVGGAVAGGLASAAALRALRLPSHKESASRFVRSTFLRAHRAIGRAAQREGLGLTTSYTTLTLAMLRDGRLWTGNVGDSRLYLLREGRLAQITTDHSLVGELVADGRLDPRDALHHPDRNVITRSLGGTEAPTVDVESRPLVPGDTVLLCTDGLWSALQDDEIAWLLGTDATANVLAARLVEVANSAGGADNVSVVVLRVV